MKILLLGGDGFCGWPAALHFSRLGHSIVIVDNLSRNRIDVELGVQSLTPIQPTSVRLEVWKAVSGSDVRFVHLDIAVDYDRLQELIASERPDAVIHFAEQRSAPYSMRSSRHKRYTVTNNIGVTHNVLAALVESGIDAHLIHIGSIGIYGYSGSIGHVPEGYLDVRGERADGVSWVREIIHPTSAGSIYHMTKAQDQLMFQFYNSHNLVRITTLNQGIVWGTQTTDTVRDERLINRFDYDGDYGTVLNRFLMQAALGIPLTVYGSGGQSRAFIHIEDTVRCIQLALETPPMTGDRLRIINQVSEVHRVVDLAHKVARVSGASIMHLDNPRTEADANDFSVSNETLRHLGFRPTVVEDHLIEGMLEIARKYAHRVDRGKVSNAMRWNVRS